MFCVKVGELKTENRYDPIYYADNLFGFLVNKKFEIVEISSVVKSLKNGFAAGLQDQSESGILHIRPTNLNSDNEIKQDKNIYISKTNKNHKEEYLISKNSVLFNNTNSQELVGKSVYFNLEEKCFYSNHITNIVTNEKIDPIYLTHLLNLYHKLKIPFRTCTNWNNQSGVGIELLKTFKIPLPPLPIQQKLADMMDEAYTLKKAKETEAKELIDSIDGYVMAELGIKVEIKEEKKVFAVGVSSLFGGRIDPEFVQGEVKIRSKYSITSIENLHLNIGSGQPIRKDKRSENGKYPYYGANGIIGKMNEFTNDGRFLIVAQDGYIGNHYFVEGKFWASNHTWLIEENEVIDFNYLKIVLDSINYQHLITGGVIPKLTKLSLLSIKIPLPPLPIQQSIAAEVMNRRARAKTLQNQAKEILETAKAQFENEILI